VDLTTTCFGGGLLTVLMADDRNAKHVDWNSWLSTRRNSYVIMLKRTPV
jgi:hypothetical protein